MKYGWLILALAFTSCGPTNSQQQFKDWSYRTRDREHNRYDGYTPHHIREEQWQTDPYWTIGEGKQRRDNEKARAFSNAIEAREKTPQR